MGAECLNGARSDLCGGRGETRVPTAINKLITRINQERQHANLSSEIRLLVLDHYRRLAEERAAERKGANAVER